MRFPTISQKFIKGAEFKARQLWLDFGDVAGTVLEALEPVKAAAWAWFRQWRKAFRTTAKPQKAAEQLVLYLENARL